MSRARLADPIYTRLCVKRVKLCKVCKVCKAVAEGLGSWEGKTRSRGRRKDTIQHEMVQSQREIWIYISTAAGTRRRTIIENGSISERLFWRYTPRGVHGQQHLALFNKIQPDMNASAAAKTRQDKASLQSAAGKQATPTADLRLCVCSGGQSRLLPRQDGIEAGERGHDRGIKNSTNLSDIMTDCCVGSSPSIPALSR